MFDHPSVRFSGPLTVHAPGLWARLLRQGYKDRSAKELLRIAAHLSRWLEATGVHAWNLTEDRLGEFVALRRRQGPLPWRSLQGLRPLLTYLREVEVIPPPPAAARSSPTDVLLTEYEKYLVREQGVCTATIRTYVGFARWFSAAHANLQLTELTASDVTRFILGETHRSSAVSAKNSATRLRSLLRFLYVRGWTRRDLAPAVPVPARRRLAALPKALEVKQADHLLRSFDLDTPVGRRDSAIIHLLLRLGLRAGEVTALALDDVDWRRGEVLVHGKGRRETRLPLPQDVGRALASYLDRGRPAGSSRRIFLRSRAPHSPLAIGSTIDVVSRALRRVGAPSGGAHLLRHTAATQMLRAGASLSEIGQALRHRHIDTVNNTPN